MVPAFLLPESTVREDGQGAEITLGNYQRKPLLLTLGINRILEQESLEVYVWGSSGGQQWTPVAAFPPKSYCGTYYLTVDLSRLPDVASLRGHWKMSRWDQRRQQPLFGFYLYVEELRVRVAGAA
jgi:hypothetical protein